LGVQGDYPPGGVQGQSPWFGRNDDQIIVLEEISSVVLPRPGCGAGEIQLLNLEGPRILPTGAGCVILSCDQALCTQLIQQRLRPPSGAACALGLSVLAGLPGRLQRRRELAERYLTLQTHELITLPENPPAGRAWEMFVLTLQDEATRRELEAFLLKAGIGCGSPLWFHPRSQTLEMEGILNRSLAVPLYASLSDAECKRIINRIHRWSKRKRKIDGTFQ
ncbi:MAG: DegT/DnrJ/EryC1/StrS aminotransferase family protein, partial [Magnetococcales bacterium]|nr:DegT/DnrJ/EryC1/StrS aminotransferase family protein [Magnetococcales bacterium]